MKVAIIGAGLAGLACAHELESFGIYPDIYERNDFIGEQYNHVSALIQVVQRPVKDYIKYFKDKFQINVDPITTVNSIVHFGPSASSTITGNLGYFVKRGRDKDDLKQQLYLQLKKPKVIFNTFGDYNILKRKYDYVVIATGHTGFAEELGCFQSWIKGMIKGAVVHGTFNKNELLAWVNKDYFKNGYAYLAPYDEKKAVLAMIVPYITEKEIEHYWQKFIQGENIKYTIIEEFKQEHSSGFGYPHRVGNILFAGNAAGIIDPFLGFGQINSISMGVFAARSIAMGLNYEKQIKNLMKKNLQLFELRRSFNKLTNIQLDMLMVSIGLPGIKQFIYDTNIDLVKYLAFFIKPFNKDT